MTGSCRRCGVAAEALNMVGWCVRCNDRTLHRETPARQDPTLTMTWVGALSAPDLVDRVAAADAEDDWRIAVWCRASAR